MEQYTDDERVEDLKKWWRENGPSILIGIALGIVAIFGWRYWTEYRATQSEQASAVYDTFIEALEKPDHAQAQQRAQSLQADFPKSTYSAMAMLRLAKQAAENGDLAAAGQRLQWVIDHAQLEELQDIARLRLARVLFADGKLDEANRRLEQVKTTTLSAEREELRGDVALAKNEAGKARTAYAQALAAGSSNSLLRLKLDNLAEATADNVVIAAPAPSAPEPEPTPPVEPKAEEATAPAEAAAAAPAAPQAETTAPAEATAEAPTAPQTETTAPAEAATEAPAAPQAESASANAATAEAQSASPQTEPAAQSAPQDAGSTQQ